MPRRTGRGFGSGIFRSPDPPPPGRLLKENDMELHWFSIRYIWGFQGELRQNQETRLRAASLEDALRRFSDWPVEVRYNRTTAWAKNPGTSLYYVEAWEAEREFAD